MSKKKNESKSGSFQKLKVKYKVEYEATISNVQQRYPKWRIFALVAIAVIAIVIGLAIGLQPSNEANTAQEGDTVKVTYKGTADDGWIFDSEGISEGSSPKELIVGVSMNMPPGFMKALIGMKVNQTKTIRVAPEEGFGPTEITEDIAHFPSDANVSVGNLFSIVTPEGVYMETQVISVSGSTVILENTTPLAGQFVNYEITMVELTKAQPAGNSSTNTSN